MHNLRHTRGVSPYKGQVVGAYLNTGEVQSVLQQTGVVSPYQVLQTEVVIPYKDEDKGDPQEVELVSNFKEDQQSDSQEVGMVSPYTNDQQADHHAEGVVLVAPTDDCQEDLTQEDEKDDVTTFTVTVEPVDYYEEEGQNQGLLQQD